MKAIQKLLIPLALVLTILCLLTALLSGPVVRIGGQSFMVGFTMLKWSVYLAGIPALLVIIHTILAKLSDTKPLFSTKSALIMIICAGIFIVPYTVRTEFMKTPTIADATTSFEDAPVFVDLVPIREKTSKNPLEYRAGDAIEKQKQFFPELVTLESSKTPTEIIETAANIATELGLEVASIKPEEGRMEATETTFWFGFKDDVVIRARALDSGMTQVDVRSASRVGFLDGGVNAKRVKKFLDALAEG